MNVQVRRHLLVDQPQEREELLVPVSDLALGDHLAGGDVQAANRVVVPGRR